MPDGTNVDFGDLPPDQIRSLIASKFPDVVPHQPLQAPDDLNPAQSIAHAITPNIYDARATKSKEIDQAQASGQQGPIQSYLQHLGNTAGYATDVIGAGLGLGNDVAKWAIPGLSSAEDLGQSALSKVGGAIGSLPTFNGSTLVQTVPGEVSALQKAYPVANRDIGALANIASVALPVPGVEKSVGEMALDAGVAGAKMAPDATKLAGKVAASPFKGVSTLADALNTPTINPVKQPVIDLAKKHDILLGVDDLTDDEGYKRLIKQGESLPGSGASPLKEEAQKSFNRAVSRTFTDEVDHITPEVMENARKSLGSEFQDLTKDKEFSLNKDYYNKVEQIKNMASRGGYGDAEKYIPKYLSDIEETLVGGDTIKGDRLDKLRRTFADLARTSKNDDISKLNSDFEDAITNIISSGDPEIKKQITDLKYRYKNFKTVQGLSLKDQVGGNISPTLLMNRVRNKFGEDAIATGAAGDLGEISRVGQAMRSLSDSGTASNTLAKGFLTGNTLLAVPSLLAGGVPGLALQGAASGGGLLVNRGLQGANYTTKKIEKALAKYEKTRAK
jgi:hypothetical protein